MMSNSTSGVTPSPAYVPDNTTALSSSYGSVRVSFTSLQTRTCCSPSLLPSSSMMHSPQTTSTGPGDFNDLSTMNLYIVLGGITCLIGIVLITLLSILAYLLSWYKSRRKVLDKGDTNEESGNLKFPLVRNSDEQLNTSGMELRHEHDAFMEPVSIKCFSEHVKEMHHDADRGFENEFQALDTTLTSSYDVSKLAINIKRNRFENIFPYDFSRVVLTMLEESDYINASYIDGYNKSNVYIAAQGPLSNTIGDFWRMIWEKKITAVIMLTETYEAGRAKCAQYWPAILNKEWNVGFNLAVVVTEQTQFAEYKVKTLVVNNMLQPDSEQLLVTHYHFSAWPDHGVPADKTCLIQFIQRVRKDHPYNDSAPLLVHCSAGVGRTGTFITLDSMLERMKFEATLNIFEFVTQMRLKRALMVQTDAQYAFIHDALDEFITCGDTSIPVTNMRIAMKNLSKVSGKKNGFAEQFEVLGHVSCTPNDVNCSEAFKQYNSDKNRYHDKIPYDNTRVYLKSSGARGTDYINASFIDGYKHRKSFIATQGPLEATVNDFWRMIWEQRTRAIVMLCKLQEDQNESCIQYWPDEVDKTIIYGKLKVKLTRQEEFEGYIVRKFWIAEDTQYIVPGAPDGIVVTHIHHTEWLLHGTTSKTASVLKMIDEVLRIQMSTGNNTIAVMCNDGVGRTGTFIAIYAQIERLKVEGLVDLFQYIKGIRLQRPGMVSTLEQFVMCHQILTDFLDTFENYANFKAVEN